jgi:hypothetical protein
MFRKYYAVEWNEKEDTWDVIVVGMRSNPIVTGIKDADFAEKVADELTGAYNLGVSDKERDFKEKINNMFFVG